MVIDVLKDTISDCLKLLPFLLVTYALMEAVERATGDRLARAIAKAGKSGPLLGALLGVFPQCGFSAAASNLYSAGLISMGTLLAVFMSTSDEMIPVFIAEQAGVGTIASLLITKFVIACLSGYLVVFLTRRFFSEKEAALSAHRKEHGHDCSEDGHGIAVEVLIRTAKTFAFIFIITFVLNGLIEALGKDALASVFRDVPVLGEMVSGLVGLIPNCAASILISQLYLSGVIGPGALMSGLLVSAGVGMLVLFEENRNMRENLAIVGILYVLSVVWGVIIELIGISF